jgi:hypothetical protein
LAVVAAGGVVVDGSPPWSPERTSRIAIVAASRNAAGAA